MTLAEVGINLNEQQANEIIRLGEMLKNCIVFSSQNGPMAIVHELSPGCIETMIVICQEAPELIPEVHRYAEYLYKLKKTKRRSQKKLALVYTRQRGKGDGL